MDGPPRAVRAQATETGMTRARVYQLFGECVRIMHVRWPNGREQLEVLERQMERANADDEQVEFLVGVREFFFPSKTINADA